MKSECGDESGRFVYYYRVALGKLIPLSLSFLGGKAEQAVSSLEDCVRIEAEEAKCSLPSRLCSRRGGEPAPRAVLGRGPGLLRGLLTVRGAFTVSPELLGPSFNSTPSKTRF